MIIRTPPGELFLPFVSRWLREQLDQTTLFPGSTHELDATLLYADLSDFTALTAAFTALPDGAERLHDALTLFYSTLVTIIAAYDGDVVAIAGDALTAWWPGRVDVERGRHCAAAMLAALATLPAISTPQGPFRLNLRVGVAAGPVRVVLAGLTAHGVHMALYGPALTAAAAAERAAAPGEVRGVSGNLAALPEPAPALPAGAITGISGTHLTIEHFLAPAFARRLHSGALVAEYRRCAPAFAAFRLPPNAAALHDLVARVQTVVARWGGWLNEVEVGDKGAVFVLLFGAPVAHGDDPARAVGCCLELRDRKLITHAGVTVGTLFVGAVGSPSRRVFTAQGDEMNLAAHLMQAATPGHILVSGRVYHEITGRYQAGASTTVVVKGHARPVPVRYVTAPIPRHERPNELTLRRYRPDTTPLIGRADERAVLTQAVCRACAGEPQVVLIEGESGIGKSALLQELMALWLNRELPAYSGECNSGVTGPFLAWQPILADLCAIDETWPRATQLARLATILSDLCIDPPPSGDSELRLLTRLLGIDEDESLRLNPDGAIPASSDARHDPAHTRMCAIAAALVRHSLTQAPRLIVIEDVHWADEPTLRLAAHLVAASADAPHALLLALSHRPIDEPSPSLAMLHAHPGCMRLVMNPLSPDESLELMRMLLDGHDLEPSLVHLIDRHTEGQPLFIREYIRALCERNIIAMENGIARLHTSPDTVQVSDTVQGIIQARVDRLDEATRLTLKVAAVIGHTFPLALLADIHPAAAPPDLLLDQLAHLSALQIIEQELDEPARVYRFKHRITHEVAYASLLFGQRRTLHAAVAAWYEMVYADDIQSRCAAGAVYEMLIYHHGRAENLVQQVRYYRAAGADAMRQYANTKALEYLNAALTLATDPAQRFELLLLRATINKRLGERTNRLSDIAALSALANRLDDDLRRAQVGFCHIDVLLDGGSYDAAIAEAIQVRKVIGRALRRVARAERSKALLLWAGCLDGEGRACAGLGDPLTAQMLHEQALTLCYRVIATCDQMSTEANDLNGLTIALTPTLLVARCLNNLGAAWFALDSPTIARHCHQEALALAQTTGNDIEEARALALLSQVMGATGDWKTARRMGEQALAISRATGDRAGQSLALRCMAAAIVAECDYVVAQRYAMHALDISNSIGAGALDALILHDLADIALALGDLDNAAATRTAAEFVTRQAIDAWHIAL